MNEPRPRTSKSPSVYEQIVSSRPGLYQPGSSALMVRNWYRDHCSRSFYIEPFCWGLGVMWDEIEFEWHVGPFYLWWGRS